MRTRVCAIALLVSFCTAVAPHGQGLAEAQDRDAVTNSARQRFLEGVRQFDKGKYEEARVAFLQAYTLKRHPAVLLNLAQSELRSGHAVDAARHLSAFLREATGASGNERAEAEKALARVRGKLGRVEVSVNTSGATVFLDGEAIGETPLPEPIDAAPGVHAIEARLAGRGVSTTVTVAVGKVTTTTLNLDAGAPPGILGNENSPAGMATTTLGNEVAEKSVEPSEPRPPQNSTPKADIPSSPEEEGAGLFGWIKESPVAWTGLVLTGAGLVTLAVGGISTAMASNNIDSVNAQIVTMAQSSRIYKEHLCWEPVEPVLKSACRTLNDNVSIRDTDVKVTIVGGVVAAIGINITLAGYITHILGAQKRKGSSDASATQPPVLVPWLGPTLSGLRFQGSF